MNPESPNVRVVREIMRLTSEGLYDDVSQYIHEDVILECPFPAFFQGPILRGKAKFVSGMAFVPQIFSSFKLSISEIYDCPDQEVVVFELTSSGVFRANSKPYGNRYIQVFGFRDGKVVLWREHFNPEVMNTMMGPLLAYM